VSHNRIGDIFYAKGNLDDARAQYRQSLAIRERLAAADPTNAAWQRELVISLVKVGEIEERLGKTAEAVERYRAAAAINARLVALDPTNAIWQNEKRWLEEKLKALGGEAKR
jgi:tetratricopeptide (TPR) repeat protein